MQIKNLISKEIDLHNIILFFFVIACLYIWPFKIVYLDKVILLAIFAILLFNKSLRSIEKIYIKHAALPIILITYFILRDIITLYQNLDLRIARWLIVHSILLVLCLTFSKLEIRFSRLYYILIIYSIVTILTQLLFAAVELSWEAEQGELISGSIIFSLPYVLSASLAASTSNNYDNKKEIGLLALVLINGIMFESRTTILLVILSLTIIFLKSGIKIRKRIEIVAPLMTLTIILSFLSGTFYSKSNEISNYQKVKGNEKVIHYLTDIKDSVLLLIQNRESDSDRVKHLRCGLKIALNRNSIDKWFGSGTNSFRYEIEKCSEFGGKDEINSSVQYLGSGSRSVSATILIVDYGIIGITLLCISILKNIMFQLRRKELYDFFVTILFVYVLFLANVNDILLVWMSLFFSLGITKNSKVSSNATRTRKLD